MRIAFVCFDALHIDGADLIGLSYAERRQTLEQLSLNYAHWLTTPSVQHGIRLRFTLTLRWEGVVAKRLDSPYRPAARNGTWLKAKHPHARTAVAKLGRGQLKRRGTVIWCVPPR